MNLERTVIALGFFDGVHRGHGALLQKTVQRAGELGAIPAVFTFDRPPKEVVTGRPMPLINSPEDRADLARRIYGIQQVILAPFDEAMMTMPWQDFITELLVKRHGAVHLVAGVTVSSTYIRTLVEAGDVERAALFLGHRHCLTQTVVHGHRLGRTLGIPTVNLTFPPHVLAPRRGVYITRVYLPDGTSLAGVTNVGTRPTVSDGTAVSVETFLLDFDGDLYGKCIRVEFCRQTRDYFAAESTRG